MIRAAVSAALLASLAFAAPTTTDIKITSEGSYASSSTLYGIMFEDINHSGDGGIYAELLRNRAFQQVTPGANDSLVSWNSVGTASIEVVNTTAPLSTALPNSLKVSFPAGVKIVGVENTGFWGISVKPSWNYTASFYVKSSSALASPINVSLTNIDGTVLATEVAVPSGSVTDSWTQYTTILYPTSTPSSVNNSLQVTFDAGDKGGEIYFALFSLFPPTYKGRENGLRIDLMETLKSMNPSFFRFPGGNNLEGQSFDTRWKWNETVGPLESRPGRIGDWTYANTDGLGLLEYLYLCEDLEVEPFMAVYSGYSLNGESVPADDFDWVWEAAINQIQFVIGDAATNEYAALRAKYGHPEPFNVTKIEVGNEDQFAIESYNAYRYNYMVGNMTKVFPDLEYMASDGHNDEGGITPNTTSMLDPTPALIDVHIYYTPDAVTGSNASCLYDVVACGRYAYPKFIGSLAEATYLTGIERNSDLVFAAAYAPVLQNINSYQWFPDLISFDAENIYLSTSFYVQQMFSANRGDIILPVSPVRAPPVYYVASKDSATGVIYLKDVLGTLRTYVLVTRNSVSSRLSTGTASTFEMSELPQPDFVPLPIALQSNATFTLIAFAILVWDSLSTLPTERRVIWKAEMSLTKIVYLINRWWTIVATAGSLGLFFSNSISPGQCQTRSFKRLDQVDQWLSPQSCHCLLTSRVFIGLLSPTSTTHFSSPSKMKKTTVGRSVPIHAAARVLPPITAPCLLHQLHNEILRQVLETSIDHEDLAPWQRQQRTFKLAAGVCRLWHALLALPEAYVAIDAFMTDRLAQKLRRDGTGESVKKLGVNYEERITLNGRCVARRAIRDLVKECPRVKELILIGDLNDIASDLVKCLPQLPLLERLEVDTSGYPNDYFSRVTLPQSFLKTIARCQNLLELDIGRFIGYDCDTYLLPGTTINLTHFDTNIASLENLRIFSAIITASSSTLTSLYLGHFQAPTDELLVELSTIIASASQLVTFGWHPFVPNHSRPDHFSLTMLAPLVHLRSVEMGSDNINSMLPSDALQNLPTVTRILLQASCLIWQAHDTPSQIIAFLSSPTSQALTHFHLHVSSSSKGWFPIQDEAQIVETGISHGIEVILD
ncbi:alpha-L-arabinofuranosidase, partial [Phenoliferia sp. Uapishka_3]